MIYDCFTFFNEIELLEIRLNILLNVVDKFVLVEGTKTHSNNDKPLYYNDNIELFNSFKHKIIHVVVDDWPEWNGDPWVFEKYQRYSIMKGLGGALDNDSIIISDLDEIPNPNIIKDLKDVDDNVFVFNSLLFRYFLNLKIIDCADWILGPRLVSYKTLKVLLPEIVRFYEYSNKLAGDLVYLKNAGWHFGYLGGYDKVLFKQKSFAHCFDSNHKNSQYNKIGMVQHILGNLGHHFEISKLDDMFPEYLLNNAIKYDDLLIKKEMLDELINYI